MAVLRPWDEIVGRVENIGEDHITLRCLHVISIRIPSDLMRNWRKASRKGSVIGILMLDDGTIKVRPIHGIEGSAH